LPEHDPEPKVSERKKWEPVFGKRSCSNKELDQDDDSTKRHPDLAATRAAFRFSGELVRATGYEHIHHPAWRRSIRTPRLDRQVEGTRVIAADAGIGHARLLGLMPELWVGDFDSVRWIYLWIRRRAAPDISARKGQDRRRTGDRSGVGAWRDPPGAGGAFGGKRADHAFLHLALSLRLAEVGTKVLLTSGAQEGVPLLPGKAASTMRRHAVFGARLFRSVGPHRVRAKWPLDHVEVAFGSSLTISNEVKANKTGGRSKSRSPWPRCFSPIPIHCLKADMAPPLLNLDGIKLTFGGTPLLDGAELTASAGDKIALVGRNGSGSRRCSRSPPG